MTKAGSRSTTRVLTEFSASRRLRAATKPSHSQARTGWSELPTCRELPADGSSEASSAGAKGLGSEDRLRDKCQVAAVGISGSNRLRRLDDLPCVGYPAKTRSS